jgi:hypothetical protein
LVTHLGNNDFTEKEIVALASIEAYGIVKNPVSSRWSTHPRFENFYYKELLTSSQDLPHKDALVNSAILRPHVENFAENKLEYHKNLKTGFVKLCEQGHDPSDLAPIDEFMNDDPRFNLQYVKYG